MAKDNNETPNLARYLDEAEQSARPAGQEQREPEPEFTPGRRRVESFEDSEGFFHLDVASFPMAPFYEPGTQVMIRPAKTSEIQAFSVVNEENLFDVIMKMNAIFASCVRVMRADGTRGTYRELKDGDRVYLITEISRATARDGKHLVNKATCPTCGTECMIKLNRDHYVYHQPDQALIDKYFSDDEMCFVFPLRKTGGVLKVGPPTMGVTMDILQHTLERASAKKEQPNPAFMLCIPWKLYDRKSITMEGFEKHELEFSNMSRNDFVALDAVVKKMKFGISELVDMCQCGTEVRTEFTFPGGAAALFLVADAFDELIG